MKLSIVKSEYGASYRWFRGVMLNSPELDRPHWSKWRVKIGLRWPPVLWHHYLAWRWLKGQILDTYIDVGIFKIGIYIGGDRFGGSDEIEFDVEEDEENGGNEGE